MNPNFSDGQSGFTPDPKNNDNSVNYLRRLKAETEGETVPKASTAALGAHHPRERERRRSPRFRCTGSVALTPEGTEVRMWGTLTDISQRGCYIEMSSTLPVDTKVLLVLDALGIRIRAKGIVRIAYPGLGMGVLMTELAPEQQEFLNQLLGTLSNGTAVPTAQLVQERSAADVIAAADPSPFLNELRRFFDRKSTLSREEFFRIADRCQRS